MTIQSRYYIYMNFAFHALLVRVGVYAAATVPPSEPATARSAQPDIIRKVIFFADRETSPRLTTELSCLFLSPVVF